VVDRWLKELKQPDNERNPVRLFVMGTNQWRDEDEMAAGAGQTEVLFDRQRRPDD